ncbi:helix-turn-helix domain-containing protein [Hymenobacter oligotrophus]|uniref:helix-turn-helix domain-containing protein n=1 Tax=Hymenobacter oligotrophus TaxID=2319843 RepID=UPI0019690185|nr:helix-turn-helix domain-containing protein [Hymenobacter oligotrophus]
MYNMNVDLTNENMAKVETVGQRFSHLIQTLGMSKNAFALSLDKTATVIQHIVEERNKPGFDLLCKVFEVYPNVSKEWLMQGFGQMFNNGAFGDNASAHTAVTADTTTNATTTPQPAAEPIKAATAQIATSDLAAFTAPDTVAEPPVSEVASAVAPEPAGVAGGAAPATAPVQVVSLEAALYAQQLQHQLVLAEMRNQHLQEQQKMLQQMVEMMSRQLSR